MHPSPNARASEMMSLLAVRNPASQGVATVTTGWISAKDHALFLAIIGVGAMTATSTVDAKLQQATDGSGTGVKDVAGKAITQLTQAGTDDNKQVEINLKPSELDVANGFDYFRLSITVAAAASLLYAEVWGLSPRYGVAANYNVATVDEVVA